MAGNDATVKIKIAENKMRVLATYIPNTEDGKPLTSEDVMKILEESNVKAGVKSDIIGRMCESDRPIPSVVVAEAIPPQTGVSARIETYVKPNTRSKAVKREDGSIDFRNLGEVASAVKNQKLYKIIPPTIGAPGKNVLGNEISGIPGKDIKLVTGAGTSVDPEDSNVVIAVKDGELLIVDGIMQISEVHKVAGHVDYESGNVTFKGSVVIGGDVKAGFKVEADGDIEIHGNVEDAEVTGKNDVVIHGGCTGSGKGKIHAGRDLLIKFVENQILSANRDIVISGDSSHANLVAGRSILAKGLKSTIVGGECQTKVSVEVARLGSVACTPTKLKVGIDPKLAEKINQTDEEIAKTKESEEKLEKSVVFLYRLKIDNKGQLPPDKTKLLEQLESVKKSLPGKLDTLEKYKEKLLEEQKEVENAFVKANIGVFPKVQVYIGNQFVLVNENLGPSQFRLVDGEVARLSK